jgi:predicted O-linked N-acetylglucosamine transferase (SPINDLY family)
MSRLYERDVQRDSAANLSREVMAFAKDHLQLAAKPYYAANSQSQSARRDKRTKTNKGAKASKAATGAKVTKGVKASKAVMTRARPRVRLLSPQFGVSPVYFLTIAGWRKVARECELIIFNRGHQQDWATQQFAHLASQWVNVQHMGAAALAQTIYENDIDVLYDLGGWMDPLGLQALSLRPARVQYKWWWAKYHDGFRSF